MNLKIVRLIGPTADCSPINSIKVSPSVGLCRRVSIPFNLFCEKIKVLLFCEMYSSMQNGTAKAPQEEKYRSVDVRSDTVTKPTSAMMTAMMEVRSV